MPETKVATSDMATKSFFLKIFIQLKISKISIRTWKNLNIFATQQVVERLRSSSRFQFVLFVLLVILVAEIKSDERANDEHENENCVIDGAELLERRGDVFDIFLHLKPFHGSIISQITRRRAQTQLKLGSCRGSSLIITSVTPEM